MCAWGPSRDSQPAIPKTTGEALLGRLTYWPAARTCRTSDEGVSILLCARGGVWRGQGRKKTPTFSPVVCAQCACAHQTAYATIPEAMALSRNMTAVLFCTTPGTLAATFPRLEWYP